MKVVILGCGRTGANLAKMLAAEGHQVTIIDKERASFSRLGPDFNGTMVIGIGIDEDVLRRAGIEEAEAFVAVTNGDNTNAMAAQVARDIFGVRRVVCRIYDPLRAEIYHKLGLEVICPTLWGATWIKEILES
jgi:trk system potassium uptake protein TrkA